VHYLPLDDELRLHDPVSQLVLLRRTHVGAGLVAFPAQSNFSGVQHPLALVDRPARSATPCCSMRRRSFRRRHSACGGSRRTSSPARSTRCSATRPGVGALIARREALARLRRPWFAGGAVEYVSVQHGSHLLREGAEGFEDGTVSFLDAEAVIRGLDFLDDVGWRASGATWRRSPRRSWSELRELTHADGSPMIRLYGPRDRYDCGGTVTFNVLDATARRCRTSSSRSAHAARRLGARGCFCNPGASEAAFGLRPDRAARASPRPARGLEPRALRAADAGVWRVARDRRHPSVGRDRVERTGSGEARRGGGSVKALLYWVLVLRRTRPARRVPRMLGRRSINNALFRADR
jgi:hypothetical protein